MADPVDPNTDLVAVGDLIHPSGGDLRINTASVLDTDIVFQDWEGAATLRISADGAIRVRGKLAATDQEVYHALREAIGLAPLPEESVPLLTGDNHVDSGHYITAFPDGDDGRCSHGMNFSGAGACPQCGGGADLLGDSEDLRDEYEQASGNVIDQDDSILDSGGRVIGEYSLEMARSYLDAAGGED